MNKQYIEDLYNNNTTVIKNKLIVWQVSEKQELNNKVEWLFYTRGVPLKIINRYYPEYTGNIYVSNKKDPV